MPLARNTRRSYDGSSRRAQAAQRRDGLLEHARTLFLANGYARTTVAAIAEAAGVSVETVYKAFGGKPGIVRALVERSLLGAAAPGDATQPAAEERSDAAQLEAPDAGSVFRRFGEFSREVAPLIAPMLRLIRDAAAGGDRAMSDLLREVEDKRYQRMLHNARVLDHRGFLATGVTVERAADVMWFYTSGGVFENLVDGRGWTLDAYGDFIAASLDDALGRAAERLSG